MKDQLQDRWIWITGASSGIGQELTRQLAVNNRLIISARNIEKLEQLRSISPDTISILPVDLSKPEETHLLADKLSMITSELDTVILNAGDCEYIDLPKIDLEKIEHNINVNYLGLVRSVDASLELLRCSSKQPHIVGISSASVFHGLPRAEGYGSSKIAVKYFLESLRVDLYQYGVTVSIAYPGFVDTPLTKRNDFPMPMLLDSKTAAKKIIQGIDKRKANISFPLPLVIMLKLLDWLPVSVSVRISQRLVRS